MISFLLMLIVAACGETTGPLSVASPAAGPVITTVSVPAPTSAAESKSVTYRPNQADSQGATYRPNQADSQGMKAPAITKVKHSSNYAVAF